METKMMMFDDPNKMISMIVGKLDKDRQPREKPTNGNGDEIDRSFGMKAAASDIDRSIRQNDVDSLVRSLEAFISMVMDKREEEKESPNEHPIGGE